MFRIIAALLAGILLCAQTPMLPGFPPGTFQNRAAIDAAPAAGYQGPGDIFSSATAWGSCARVYTAAQASTSTSLCDLTASTGGAAVCTLRGSSTGFVDLSAYCPGSLTPSAACAAASGGACRISKVYDQSGNGNDFTNATGASQPDLNFAGANSLPGIAAVNGRATTLGSPNLTISQPITMSAVYKITTHVNSGAVIAASGSLVGIGEGTAAANLSNVFGGTVAGNIAATDNNYYAVQGLMSGTGNNCAINVNNSDTASLNCGTTGFSATPARIGRNNGGITMTGVIMEVGIWGATSNSTTRGSLATNQRSSTSGYNF